MHIFLLFSNLICSFITDWLKLRRDHRILGELVGSFSRSTRQDIFLGLPLLLLPEEVTLLLEKNIAHLIKYRSLEKPPTVSLSKKFEEYRNILFVQQSVCLRENRRKQVTIANIFYIAKII